MASPQEILPGERKIVKVGGLEIGVFNLNGAYLAFHNRCPHQGAPVCLGVLDGSNLPSRPHEYRWGKQGQILRCPWHAWEFELPEGRALFDPEIRIKRYTVEVGEDDLWVVF